MNDSKNEPKLDVDRFAESENEAKSRHNEFKGNDPFPEIDSALLSSADIEDYARVTGMLHPFHGKLLKPVTYALVASGPYVYFSDGARKEGVLSEGQFLYLKKDSILFLTLEPLIQLPNYIAARFNLTINHVYRGLLLGTGPVVDPGFVGKLSVPLHNFTSNDYTIRGGEKLAWIEFTKVAKTTSEKVGVGKKIGRKGKNIEFDTSKNNRNVYQYVNDADKRPIESSIPLSVIRSEQSAKKAEESVKSTENWARVILGFNMALVVTVIALIWNVYKDTKVFYEDAKSKISDENREFNERMKNQLYSLEKKVRAIDSLETQRIMRRIDSIKVIINKRESKN